MHVLNVNFSIDCATGGGTAERTFKMSCHLAKNAIECSILTFYSNLSEEKMGELKNVNLIMLPCLVERFYIPKGGLDVIKQAVKKADIIHLMNHWTLLNVLVYYYIRKFNKKYIVCPAGALPIFGRSKIIKKIYNHLIGYKIIRNADAHIAVSENEIAHYMDYGLKKQQITCIPNGINQEDFQLPKSVPTQKLPEPYILFLGRLNYIKGPDLLMAAFAHLPREYETIHLVFAGPDAGMMEHLKKQALAFNLMDRVHFLGAVSGLKKLQVYNQALFLAVPSRQEAMSLVVLEAGMFAKPAVITDQCGFDILGHIKGGYIVSPSIEGLTEGLTKMLSSGDACQMGQNLREMILREYTWESIGEKIIALYENMHEIVHSKFLAKAPKCH